MASVVCTLFEGSYHYGLAALINSLYANNYSKDIFIGYRGELPPWVKDKVENRAIILENVNSFSLNNGPVLHFIPVNTEIHLTNYKPTFMLLLLERIKEDIDGLVYFDPDIVIKCNWSFYETWIKYGVAVVHEIVNNDMPATHPIRQGWAQVIYKSNRKVVRELNSYINAGFCGVSKHNIEFVKVWEDIINTGINHYGYNAAQFLFVNDRSNLFYARDQDALNIAAMCSESPISEMGPEAMDFISTGWTMSHAVGTPKPWNKNYLLSAIKGNIPTKADRAFWMNVQHPITCYSNRYIKFKQLFILSAAFIGRFYKRS